MSLNFIKRILFLFCSLTIVSLTQASSNEDGLKKIIELEKKRQDLSAFDLKSKKMISKEIHKIQSGLGVFSKNTPSGSDFFSWYEQFPLIFWQILFLILLATILSLIYLLNIKRSRFLFSGFLIFTIIVGLTLRLARAKVFTTGLVISKSAFLKSGPNQEYPNTDIQLKQGMLIKVLEQKNNFFKVEDLIFKNKGWIAGKNLEIIN